MDNKYVNKALEISSKVASNVYLDAISKGLMGTLPILIIGSIGCLLGYSHLILIYNLLKNRS